MTIGILVGGLFGLSLFGLAVAVYAPKPSLASQLKTFDRELARQRAVVRVTARADWKTSLGRWLSGALASRGITYGNLRGDLALLDIPFEGFILKQAAMALLGLLVPVVFAGLMAMIGIGFGYLPLFGSLLFSVLFVVVTDLDVRASAKKARSELRHSLAIYLDLVAMYLAGGRGVPQALEASARIGKGWTFELFANTLHRAQSTGTSSWTALAELGEETRMPELTSLGQALTQVANDGAKVKASLAARAVTQRRRQLAEVESAADGADNQIGGAQVVIFVGFVIFLGFPAIYTFMKF